MICRAVAPLAILAGRRGDRRHATGAVVLPTLPRREAWRPQTRRRRRGAANLTSQGGVETAGTSHSADAVAPIAPLAGRCGGPQARRLSSADAVAPPACPSREVWRAMACHRRCVPHSRFLPSFAGRCGGPQAHRLSSADAVAPIAPLAGRCGGPQARRLSSADAVAPPACPSREVWRAMACHRRCVPHSCFLPSFAGRCGGPQALHGLFSRRSAATQSPQSGAKGANASPPCTRWRRLRRLQRQCERSGPVRASAALTPRARRASSPRRRPRSC